MLLIIIEQHCLCCVLATLCFFVCTVRYAKMCANYFTSMR